MKCQWAIPVTTNANCLHEFFDRSKSLFSREKCCARAGHFAICATDQHTTTANFVDLWLHLLCFVTSLLPLRSTSEEKRTEGDIYSLTVLGLHQIIFQRVVILQRTIVLRNLHIFPPLSVQLIFPNDAGEHVVPIHIQHKSKWQEGYLLQSRRELEVQIRCCTQKFAIEPIRKEHAKTCLRRTSHLTWGQFSASGQESTHLEQERLQLQQHHTTLVNSGHQHTAHSKRPYVCGSDTVYSWSPPNCREIDIGLCIWLKNPVYRGFDPFHAATLSVTRKFRAIAKI